MPAPSDSEAAAGRRSTRPYRLGLLVCLPLALAAALFALASLKAGNSLARSGLWTATKTVAGKSLLGAESFYRGGQALAGGVLNPGAWHGFHEVLLRDALTPRSMELDFLLTQSSYLVALVYDADRRQFAGVRLSMTRHFPNMIVEGTADGGFTAKRPIDPPIRRLEWQRLRLEFAGDAAEVTLDGEPVGSLRLPRAERYRLGFRTGFKDVYVDNVRIESREGRIADGFGWPANAAAIALAAGLAALVAGLALFLWLAGRPRRRPRTVAAYFAMLGSTLAVMAGLLLAYATYRARAPHYPAQNRDLIAKERRVQHEHLQLRRAEVGERYRQPPEPGTARILVLGTSQTWGAGARTEEETFVAVLEELLRTAGIRAECINGGISAATAPHLVQVLERSWLGLDPDYLLINLGNNDRDVAEFEQAVGRMIDLAAERGVEVILLREANSTERIDSTLRGNHRALERLGTARGVPVLNLHGYLASRRDDGFLWWDKVHLTPFGQRLVAERLAKELLPRLVGGSRGQSPADD